MNVKLLKQVRDYIIAHPDSYNQGSWCGTKCCIAGHAAVLSGKVSREAVDAEALSAVVDGAQSALRLSALQADRLFMDWPDQFPWASASDIPDGAERSRIAADRINHFIKTKGAE